MTSSDSALRYAMCLCDGWTTRGCEACITRRTEVVGARCKSYEMLSVIPADAVEQIAERDVRIAELERTLVHTIKHGVSVMQVVTEVVTKAH